MAGLGGGVVVGEWNGGVGEQTAPGWKKERMYQVVVLGNTNWIKSSALKIGADRLNLTYENPEAYGLFFQDWNRALEGNTGTEFQDWKGTLAQPHTPNPKEFGHIVQ